MKTIQAFLTEDGQLFHDEGEAETHERSLKRSRAVERWVEAHIYNNMRVDDIRSAILDNHEELFRALRGGI